MGGSSVLRALPTFGGGILDLRTFWQGRGSIGRPEFARPDFGPAGKWGGIRFIFILDIARVAGGRGEPSLSEQERLPAVVYEGWMRLRGWQAQKEQGDREAAERERRTATNRRGTAARGGRTVRRTPI